MKTIAILYGGKSGEHEVSLISAASIVKHLDSKKYKVLLIGITKAGVWLLQDSTVLKKARKSEGIDGAQTMDGLPPIVSGRRIFVAPGEGLLAEKSSGEIEPLACDIVFPRPPRHLRGRRDNPGPPRVREPPLRRRWRAGLGHRHGQAHSQGTLATR